MTLRPDKMVISEIPCVMEVEKFTDEEFTEFRKTCGLMDRRAAKVHIMHNPPGTFPELFQMVEDSKLDAGPVPVTNQFPDYDKYLRLIADAQRYKLRINAHKGDLGTCPVPRLLEFLKGEVSELEEAIARESEIEIILEAADVCNFALGLAISAIRRMNGDK